MATTEHSGTEVPSAHDEADDAASKTLAASLGSNGSTRSPSSARRAFWSTGRRELVAIGLLLSAALSRLLSTLLFGVKPLDPATFALVSLLLLIGAAVSTAAPALRAARIEPAVALRDE